VVAITAALVRNPSAAADVFPGLREPTPTLFVLNTPGPVIPPTWTPSPTAVPPTPTALSPAIWTPPATRIPGDLPTPTPGSAAEAQVVHPFQLQGEVAYEANANDQGCDWMSIAGQVFDLSGNPLLQVGVEVRGDSFEQFEWAGSATAFGPSGYEVVLNDAPYIETWEVRLLSFNTMQISDTISVRTRSSCNDNVVIVNFAQAREWIP
jgi:hypothetical protein